MQKGLYLSAICLFRYKRVTSPRMLIVQKVLIALLWVINKYQVSFE